MALNGLYCADVPLSNYSLTPLSIGTRSVKKQQEAIGVMVQNKVARFFMAHGVVSLLLAVNSLCIGALLKSSQIQS